MSELKSDEEIFATCELMKLAIQGKFKSLIDLSEDPVGLNDSFNKFQEATDYVHSLMRKLGLLE